MCADGCGVRGILCGVVLGERAWLWSDVASILCDLAFFEDPLTTKESVVFSTE
jgi:hypothetical protein